MPNKITGGIITLLVVLFLLLLLNRNSLSNEVEKRKRSWWPSKPQTRHWEISLMHTR